MSPVAFHAARVLTPAGFQPEWCVLVDGGRIVDPMPSSDCPAHLQQRELEGDLLPGFIDLQVNGGGGVLFNNHPTLEGIRAICAAHAQFGTTPLLPTCRWPTETEWRPRLFLPGSSQAQPGR